MSIKSDEGSPSTDQEELDLCFSHWNPNDVSFLAESLKTRDGPWEDPKCPLWKEVARNLFPEAADSIAMSLANEVNTEFSLTNIVKIHKNLYTSSLLGLTSFLSLKFHGIERVLRIASREEESDVEVEDSLREYGIQYKVIYLDDTENYLPHLDSCLEFLSGEKIGLVCCNSNFPVRSLVVCVAYTVLLLENYSYHTAYDSMKKFFPGVEFTEEHHAQLQQFEQQIKMRYAKIVPLQRKICSPKRKTSPDSPASPGNKRRELELTIPTLGAVVPPSSGLTPSFRPLSLASPTSRKMSSGGLNNGADIDAPRRSIYYVKPRFLNPVTYETLEK